jgi:hypothetical protein
VKQQVAQTNARVSQLSGQVEKDRLAQAKVNANVNAETKRMIKLGNDRYKAHLKKDQELKRLIARNKAQNVARMDSMAAHYNNEINKVRATMRRNRSHASRMLARKTSQLYSAIAKSQRAQLAVNKKLARQTRRARLDIKDSLRNAKRDFGRRMAKLHSTIVRNDRKFDGKMKKLTGVVNANAVKSRRGRAMLAAMMKANRAELLGAVSGAVRKGESRMMGVENSLKSLSAKTKASLNMRITSEISKLSKNIGKSVENLRLSSKSARAEMRKEMLYAVRSAAAQAKNNLAASVRTAKAVFGKVAPTRPLLPAVPPLPVRPSLASSVPPPRPPSALCEMPFLVSTVACSPSRARLPRRSRRPTVALMPTPTRWPATPVPSRLP